MKNGSSATPYEPYVEPSINVDEEEIYKKADLDAILSNVLHIKSITNTSSGTGIQLHFTDKSQQFFIFGKCYHNSTDKLLQYHIGLSNGGLSSGVVKYKDLSANLAVVPTINNTNKTVNVLFGSFVSVLIISTNDFSVNAI